LRQTIFFLFLFSFQLVNGQQNIDLTTFDYSKADSIALNFPKKKYKSYTELVAPLTENLQTDQEKFRVLFRWITDNISYSYGNRSSDADKVVKNKKAVCIGYSTLLKEMCNSAGIECEIISGYSKTDIKDINKKYKKTDHAWNAVKLYDKWYLVDVTWATSYYDDKKRKSIKSYNELYYLTPPDIFVRKHYPKDKKWQMLDKPISKSEFTKPHIYYTGFFDNHIADLQPHKGILKIRLKDTLEIKFKSDYEIKRATIELGNEQFVYRPNIEKKDSTYFIKQKFEKPGIYQLTLFLNGQSIAAYRLEVKE
jgi:transglutaminase/protease-like cytokinesis protein 3